MKFESVISETKAKGEQVWLAFDHNGDQLQLEPKWLDGGIRGPLADYVFLIRVVSICDGCPFYSHQPLMAYVMFSYLWIITMRMLSINCMRRCTSPHHVAHCLNWACLQGCKVKTTNYFNAHSVRLMQQLSERVHRNKWHRCPVEQFVPLLKVAHLPQAIIFLHFFRHTHLYFLVSDQCNRFFTHNQARLRDERCTLYRLYGTQLSFF